MKFDAWRRWPALLDLDVGDAVDFVEVADLEDDAL
jgi:hypothetical protein